MKTLTDAEIKALKYWLCEDNCECDSCLVLNELLARRARAAETAWITLTDEQRLVFLETIPCCRHCGSLNTSCRCWDDS